MRQKFGLLIRNARSAAGLTQEQLGKRLGMKGRAVYRWENDESSPTPTHRRELINAIQAVRPAAATTLLEAWVKPKKTIESVPLTTPATSPRELLELAVLRMADELDLPARRLRRPLLRLLSRARAANFTIETAEREIEAWIAEVN